jgi:hypothetical protein
MSDSIPVYRGNIAPPDSTGEVLDTQSAQLAQAKANAVVNVGNAASNVAGAAYGLTESLMRFHDLRGRDLYAAEKNRLIEESRRISDMAMQSPGAIGGWVTDASGEMGNLLKQWGEGQMELVSPDLKGRWRQQLELDFAAMQREMAGGLTELGLDHTYKSIVASDSTWLNDQISNANPQNIGESSDAILKEYQARLNNRVEMGINDPIQAAQMMAEAESAVQSAHVMAAVRAIDDGDKDPWTFDATGVQYDGMDGALDFIDDLEEAGAINGAEAAQYRDNVFEIDAAKYSRGVKVQQERSNSGRREYLEFMENGVFMVPANRNEDGTRSGPNVPLNQAILNDWWFQSERAENHNTVGDSSTIDILLGEYDRATRPSGSAAEAPDLYRSKKFMDMFYDYTISDDTFEQYIIANKDSSGSDIPYTNEEIIKLMRERSTVDTYKLSAVTEAVDRRFAPLFAGINKDDVAENQRLNAEKQAWISAVTAAIEGPGITNRQEVETVIENVNRAIANGKITEAVLRADPRRTNIHEEILMGQDSGHYMGLFDVPGMADQLAKVAEVGRRQIVDIYGGDETVIEDMVWGKRGTPDEGRMFYYVTDTRQLDANGNPKKLWLKWESAPGRGDGLEEQLVEWDGETDAMGNERWRPTQRPALDALAAEREAQEEATDESLYDAYYIEGTSWDDLVQRFGLERVQRVLGRQEENVPDTPDFESPVARQWEYFEQNSDNGKIDVAALNAYLAFQPLPADGSWDELYMTIADKYSNQIQADIQARGITPFNNNGNVKASADRIVGRIIEDYGIPRRLAEEIILKYYGAP